MGKESLNGSVELLAKAMRTVFSEAVEGATEPLHEDMQSQFAAQEKKIGQLLKAPR